MLDKVIGWCIVILLSSFWLVLLCKMVWSTLREVRLGKRLRFIAGYASADGITVRLKARYPHLSESERPRVIEGLRSYFTLVARHGPRLAMPSRAVDSVWHDFLLYTREYAAFCRLAFGRFFHHAPFESLPSREMAEASLSAIWLDACGAENIDPLFPERLPELFALDGELGIPDGFHHALDNSYYL